jgi:hypothetical protein
MVELVDNFFGTFLYGLVVETVATKTRLSIACMGVSVELDESAVI